MIHVMKFQDQSKNMKTFVIHVAFLLKYDMITKLSRLNLANISINFSLTNVYRAEKIYIPLYLKIYQNVKLQK